MSQHTPGPWTADSYQDANANHTIRRWDGSENGDTDNQPIATVYEWDDARLIAAAPAMLDALERIAKVRPAHLTVDLRQIVDAAIAAARGDK